MASTNTSDILLRGLPTDQAERLNEIATEEEFPSRVSYLIKLVERICSDKWAMIMLDFQIDPIAVNLW